MTLHDVIASVELNNAEFGARWSDFGTARDIIEWAQADLSDDEIEVLERAIDSNGSSIEFDLAVLGFVQSEVEQGILEEARDGRVVLSEYGFTDLDIDYAEKHHEFSWREIEAMVRARLIEKAGEA